MIVGLTGGIGAGKSTVASVLKVLGHQVYNSDERARILSDENADIVSHIKSLFGDDIYTKGKLNRKLVAELVFNDSSKLMDLNSIIHPAVADDFIKWHKSCKAQLVFKEAAILFESNAYKSVNKVITVEAPEHIRINRVCKRDGVSAEQVAQRMRHQWTEKQRRELADFVILADDKHMVIPQVISILKKLKQE